MELTRHNVWEGLTFDEACSLLNCHVGQRVGISMWDGCFGAVTLHTYGSLSRLEAINCDACFGVGRRGFASWIPSSAPRLPGVARWKPT